MIPLQDGSVVARFTANFLNGQLLQDEGRYFRLLRDGSLDPNWPLKRNRDVDVVVTDLADGSLLVGGSFARLIGPQGHEPRLRIARLGADASLLPWTLQPAADETALTRVTAILPLTDGGLVFADHLASGGFRLCTAAANTQEFRCPQQVQGFAEELHALADGSVLVEGRALQLGASAQSRLLRFQPQTLAWDASFVFDGSQFSSKLAVAVQGNTVWAANSTRLYRLAADGSAEVADSLAARGSLADLHIDAEGQLLIAENAIPPEFLRTHASASKILASSTLARDPAWQSEAVPGWAETLESRGDRLYLGGPLHSLESGTAGILELSKFDGTLLPDTLPARLARFAQYGAWSAVATSDGGAVFTGEFTQSLLGMAPGILKVDAQGVPVAGWGEVPRGGYWTAAAGDDGFVYVLTAFGVSQNHLRRVRLEDGQLDHSWSLFLGELTPWAMAVRDDELWFAFNPHFGNEAVGVGRLSTTTPPELDPSWGSPSLAFGWPTRIFPGGDGSALVHVIRGGPDAEFYPPPPQPTPSFRHLHRFVLDGTGASIEPAGPQDSSSTGIPAVEPMADGSLLIVRYENGGMRLKRFLASGAWDPDFAPVLGDKVLGRTIALDEARGKLYFTAETPSTPNLFGYCVMRLDLATQTIDSDWPGPESQLCDSYLQLSVHGDRVFAAQARWMTDGSSPLGGFLSVHVPPMFADGFEGD